MVASFMVLMSLAVVPTFAYWSGSVFGANKIANVTIEIGEWDNLIAVRINPNQSNDFEGLDYSSVSYADYDNDTGDLIIYVDRDYNPTFLDVKDLLTELETDLGKPSGYFTSLKPKTHSGVDQSVYAFEDWYFAGGTKVADNYSITGEITVYPSWDTSLFTYQKSSNVYNIQKPAGVTYATNQDLYIPGWLYKGLSIDSVWQGTMRYIEVANLTLGQGIKKVASNAFRDVVATSLTLNEDLEDIGQDAFRDTDIPCILRIPPGLKTMKTHAFFNGKFTFINLEDAINLEEIAVSAFAVSTFGSNQALPGDLVIPANVKSIGQSAFNQFGLTGELDLTLAQDLTFIGPHAFSGNRLVGEIFIGGKVTEIGGSAFKDNLFTYLDMSEATSLLEIKASAFSGCSLMGNEFPMNGAPMNIGAQVFQSNSLQGAIVLPNNLKEIGGVVFGGNSLVTSIWLPSTLDIVGGNIMPHSNPNTFTFYYEGDKTVIDAKEAAGEWYSRWNYYSAPVVYNYPLPN